MKTLRIILLSAVLIPTLFTSYANAQILLTIDDSNPNAVTFTATGNAPGVSDSTHRYSQGITLTGFYATANFSGADLGVTGSTLVTGVDGAPVFDSEQSNSIGGGANNGIQLSTGSASFENFVTGKTAFTGTVTFDLSANAAFLPAFGTMGNLYAGSSALFSPTPVLIGQYQVVQTAPEPRQYALMLFGAVGLIAFARLKGQTPVRGNLG